MIGSLLYLTTSISDIMFSIGLFVRFQSFSKGPHLKAIKHIFKYLIGTQNLELWYPKNGCMKLVSYSDANFTKCKLD